MSDQTISKLLTNLGWGSGFRLPIANAENRKLETLLEAKQRKNLVHRTKVEDERHHVENLANELERVTIRVSNSLKIVSTGRGTHTHTKNLNCLSEKLCERVERECKLKHKELNTLKERNMKFKMELDKRRQQIDELSHVLKWDKSQLEGLKQAGAEHENDIEFMQKYLDLDRKVITETESQYKSQAEKLIRSRKELEVIARQTQAADSTYERLCRQFRRVHNERNQAVKFWKNVLDTLKLRDGDIYDIAMDFIATRGRFHQVSNIYSQRAEHLETAQRHNQEMKSYLHRHERVVSDLKLEQTAEKKRFKELGDSTQGLRGVINQTGAAIQQINVKKAGMQRSIKAAYLLLEKRRAEVLKMRRTLEENKSGALSCEERMMQMKDLVEKEEKRMEAFKKELERLHKCKFEILEKSSYLKGQDTEITYKIRTTEMSFKKLRRICKNQDFVLHLSKQKVYKLELHVLIIQNKIKTILDPPVIDINAPAIKYSTQTNLEKLRKTLQDIVKSKAFLMNQKGHMDDIVRRLHKEIEVPKEEQIALKEQLRHLDTAKSLITRQANKCAEELQNVRFDLSMEKLRMNRMKKLFKSRRTKIGRLEHNRVLIKGAAHERRTEIRCHMAILQQRRKHLLDTKAQLTSFLQEVETKIRVWTTKYDITLSTISGSGEDGKSQAFSEAYFILKAASERESLKREGDIWDKRVKESEKELIGLQNTLAVMVNANQCFRDSLEPVVKGSERDILREKMEQAKRVAIVRIRKARQKCHLIERHNADKEREIIQLEQVVRELIGSTQDRKFELHNILLEIANQKAKLARASLVTKRMVKQLEHKSITEKQLLEIELKLRCTREKYSFAIQTLDRAFGQFPHLKEPVARYLRKHHHHKMFTKLVKKIESRHDSNSYHSPLRSEAGTPLPGPSDIQLPSDNPEPEQPHEEE